MNTVLCVMDGELSRESIKNILETIGFECQFIPINSLTLALLPDQEISAVLLDASSTPERAGEVAGQIRKISDLPILAVIRPDQTRNLSDFLNKGASDFVMFPIRAEELALRLQVLLIRGMQGPSHTSREVLKCGNLLLDIKEHRVWRDDQQIAVSPMGFSLLTYFMTHEGQLVSKPQLMQDVWKYSSPTDNANLVEIGIARLRRELGEDPKEPVYLHTIWGKGYRFEYHKPLEP